MNLLSRKRNYYYLYCFLPAALLLLSSCKEKKSDITHISGKIINPHKNYVTLSNYDGMTDTILLSSDGSFSKNYKSLSAGLYTFSHPNEYQSVYLSPGDSTVLRLNTKAFDETLAFSGTHSKENNYLINLFVKIEKEDIAFLNNYKKPHDQFKKNVDSLIAARLEQLEIETKNHQLDKDFICHVEEIIKLSGWSKLENYPYVHYGKNNFLNSKELPDSFYEHRKDFKICNATHLNNIAYRPYVNSLISNLAFKSIAQEIGTGKLVDGHSYRYYEKKLAIIDSLFPPGIVKDIFAANDTQKFIMNRKNAREINDLVSLFVKMTDNEKYKNHITNMAATYIKLDPGNEMPDIKLQNTDKVQHSLSDRVNKLSVLFFWSDNEREYALRVHDKIKELRIKYPEIDFIGINLDNSESEQWKKAYERYNFNSSMEFQILNTSPVSSQLALRNNNRSMVIDKNMTIIDPSINLFHYQIETTLLGYINR